MTQFRFAVGRESTAAAPLTLAPSGSWRLFAAWLFASVILIAVVGGCSSSSATHRDASADSSALADQLGTSDAVLDVAAADLETSVDNDADSVGDEDLADSLVGADGTTEASDTSMDAGDTGDTSADAGDLVPSCPSVSSPMSAGIVESPLLTEISGLIASRSQPSILWVHNDSGDTATIYALDRSGALLQRFRLNDETAVDWEDLAIGPGPSGGVDYLYIGDIGDNAQSRPSVMVFVLPEPTVDGLEEEVLVESSSVLHLTLHYPGAKQNSEALFVDPASGDLYLIAKQTSGAAQIFKKAAPHQDGDDVTLELVGTLGVPNALVTGADISVDGARIIVRTYNKAFLWERDGASIVEALTKPTCTVPLPSQPQGESIALDFDGSGYLTISEGAKPTVYRLDFDL